MTDIRKPAELLEAIIFAVLGFLMLYTVITGVSKYFVAHRMRPFIVGTGILFLFWFLQDLYRYSSRKADCPHCCNEDSWGLHLAVLTVLVLCTGTSVIHYRSCVIPAAGRDYRRVQADGHMSKETVDAMILHYPEDRIAAEEQAAAGQFCDGDAIKKDDHTLLDDSKTVLEGYYPEKKRIVIGDTQLYGWISELALHTKRFEGWTITVRGQVVTDPQLFEPGTFTPARKLMTCCVADLATIGLTCRYDTNGPFSKLIRDGTWVQVTGILAEGSYQGDPEPQIRCTRIVETKPPADPYVYPER